MNNGLDNLVEVKPQSELVTISFGKLKILKKSDLMEERNDLMAEYKDLEVIDANYNKLKKAKNRMVKMRTGLAVLKKFDTDYIKEKYNEFVGKINTDYEDIDNITVPTECKYANKVKEVDQKDADLKAIEDAKEQDRKDQIETALKDYEHNAQALISGMELSTDEIDITLPELEYAEYEDLAKEMFTNMATLKTAKIEDLIEREDFAKKKAIQDNKDAELKVKEDALNKKLADLEALEVKARGASKPQNTSKVSNNTIKEVGNTDLSEETAQNVQNMDLDKELTSDQIGELEVVANELDGLLGTESDVEDFIGVVSYPLEFVIKVTGHDEATITQMYNDWCVRN